ncbi:MULTISPECIES: hypothetical protein [Fusobacterium]|nr:MULTISPECIES: hypothetical protein [Fusobacterium]EUB37062.1 hypothetical protein HMPREF1501_0525 [Fusobacterium sp. OBRC1]WRL73932.1 hypothetical protein VKN77_04795 [Fusobacterium polymorphum]
MENVSIKKANETIIIQNSKRAFKHLLTILLEYIASLIFWE